MKPVDLVGLHIEASSGTPLALLREQDSPHRVVPIFIGRPEAVAIAMALREEQPARPLTHDVMAAIVEGVDAHVDAVEVTGLRDGTFLAELAVSGPGGHHRVDARPSDGIALAVRLGAPLFVSEEVLDEAGAILSEAPTDEADDTEDSEDSEDIDGRWRVPHLPRRRRRRRLRPTQLTTPNGGQRRTDNAERRTAPD